LPLLQLNLKMLLPKVSALMDQRSKALRELPNQICWQNLMPQASQFFHGAPQTQALQKCSAILQCQMEARLPQIREMF